MGILEVTLLFLGVTALFAFWATLALQPGFRLRARYQFADAAAAFIRATRYFLPGDREGRAVALIYASLSFTDAGNPAQGVVWAERALQNCPKRFRIPVLLAAAHAYGSTGDPERCGWYLSDALQQAEASGKNALIAHVLLYQGLQHWRIGQFDTARSVAARMTALHPPMAAMERLIKGECLLAEGAFDAALDAFNETRNAASIIQGGPGAQAMDRRMKGLVHLEIAVTLLESGRPEVAREHLEQTSFLDKDRRVFMLCRAISLWLWSNNVWVWFPKNGDAQFIAAFQNQTAEMLSDFASDHVITTQCLLILGYTALTRQEFTVALTFFDRCRLSLPYPVEEPRLWWGIAQGRQGLGDEEGYRDALRRAVARNLPTYYSRLARAALESESLVSEKPS